MSSSCLITGLSSGNGLIVVNLDDVAKLALIGGNPVDDVSVVVTPALIRGNPVDEVSVVVELALIGGNSVDVEPALIGGNPDVDEKFSLAS